MSSLRFSNLPSVRCPNCGTMNINFLDFSSFSALNNGQPSPANVEFECPECDALIRAKYELRFLGIEKVVKMPVFNEDNMVPVKSSVIESIGYNPTEKVMGVRFLTSKKLYLYERVDGETFIEFLNAPSKGRFFQQEIRGNYPSTAKE